MGGHSNARKESGYNPGPYANFASVVQQKLWPAVKGRMSPEEMQRLSEGDGAEETQRRLRRAFVEEEISGEPPAAPSPFYADEEAPLTHDYPKEYKGPRRVEEQIIPFVRMFPHLDVEEVLDRAKRLPPVPSGAEGPYPFVVPKWHSIASCYEEALERLIALSAKIAVAPGMNLHEGDWQRIERTVAAEELINKGFRGPYALFWAQFGRRDGVARSLRRIEYVYRPNEFGIGAFAGLSMLIGNPARIQSIDDLRSVLPGDRHRKKSNVRFFSLAPIFFFYGGEVKFSDGWFGHAGVKYGSVSGFVSQ